MLNTELSSYLKRNGCQQVEFARFLGLSKDIVYLWSSGRSPVPRYVHVILSLLPEEDVRYFVCGGLELLQFEPWQTLGIAECASIAEAAKARKRLAKRLHADVGGSGDAMARVNAAFDEFCRRKG